MNIEQDNKFIVGKIVIRIYHQNNEFQYSGFRIQFEKYVSMKIWEFQSYKLKNMHGFQSIWKIVSIEIVGNFIGLGLVL